MRYLLITHLVLCQFAFGVYAHNNAKFAFQPVQEQWKNYDPGQIHFIDEAPATRGSDIYNKIIPDPDRYIAENALRVLQTLYFSPKDSIPQVKTIRYTLEDSKGISAKSGSGDHIHIFYSTRWIEKCFADSDTAKVDYETRGVLLHELTHAFQWSPQGCGAYADGGEFWTFIEGLADAVRVANGCFRPEDRPKGGNYLKGYRITGFFLDWVRRKKDKDFLRKFNRTALEVIPWSFASAFRHIFGDDEKFGVDVLWTEYMKEMGDKVNP